MSLKRKLIPCASSDDFKLIEISSGSETESATEDSVSSVFQANMTNKKMKIHQIEESTSSKVEVLFIEDEPVERKVEIVTSNKGEMCEAANKRNIDTIDVEDSDQEITFLKVEKSVESKARVKMLAELAASAWKYPGKSLIFQS